MAWYANHVFAQPTPAVISAFCSVKSLSGQIYHIQDLRDYPWGVSSPSEVRLDIPASGLLVAREICGPRSAAAEWYKLHNQPIVSWNDIIGPTDLDILFPRRRPQSCPPPGLLRFLKWVSQSTETVTSFYYCHTGGSSMGPCFSWVFDMEDRVYIYNNRRHETIEYCARGETALPVHKSVERHKQIHHPENDVLPLTLRHHGLHLNSFYFAPHTSQFEWAKYRLACAA